MRPPKTDESNIGAWYGLICVALALLPWMFFDWLLKRNGHEYITTEVREMLLNAGWKALLFVFLVGGILFVAAFHFFYQRNI